MTTDYEQALARLNTSQRDAVSVQDNPVLVLAGPGSGKTHVITTRIARLLEDSSGKRFRILALTFTNKAADEMTNRLNVLVPGLEERAFIGTFHAFCSEVLRHHGTYIGVQANFTIYAQDEDRKHVLRDARKRAPVLGPVGHDETQILKNIDRFMNRFATPVTVPSYFTDKRAGEWYAELYRRYEEELDRLNALDFNTLILRTYRLVTQYPAIATRYQQTYPYWLIDEFQDTNTAQYRLIKTLAGSTFRNLFVVADDDQIIYEWNGASYQQLERFRRDFNPTLIQLPTNYRCPSTIVAAANRLVTNNATRTPHKAPLVAAKQTTRYAASEHIRVLGFATDNDEARGIARAIQEAGKLSWGTTLVLARQRSLLEPLLGLLQDGGVPAVIAQRRDDFLTPQFRWLQLCLRQVVRPLDKNNFARLVDAYNKIGGVELFVTDLLDAAEQTHADYLSVWATTLIGQGNEDLRNTGNMVRQLQQAPERYNKIALYFEQQFGANTDNDPALREDCAAWRESRINIARTIGRTAGLDEFLQQLDLRSKEPSPPPDNVRLMTIHAAKGTEADNVYVIGMAEELIPSYQSIQKGNASAEMEEERRNCFVAITRTKEQLTLSTARVYGRWSKNPSRFLKEMDLLKELIPQPAGVTELRLKPTATVVPISGSPKRE